LSSSRLVEYRRRPLPRGDVQKRIAEVRNGSFSEVNNCRNEVRSAPVSGHRATAAARPEKCQKQALSNPVADVRFGNIQQAFCSRRSLHSLSFDHQAIGVREFKNSTSR
jgi:hypothetical protein